MMFSANYKALLIGANEFPRDPENLPRLYGPIHDLPALQAALSNSETGLFAAENIIPLSNPTKARAEHEIHDFFSSGRRDEILLFYFAGHGRLTREGKLFLCAADSTTNRIQVTGISVSTLRDCMEGSEAQTFVVILDCCHSGAFRGAPIPTEVLSGRGMFWLSSSRARQLADDGDGNGPSPFTRAIVEALADPASDIDGDGVITFDDVYRVVYNRLSKTQQYPQRSTGEGTVALARSLSVLRPAQASASQAEISFGDQRTPQYRRTQISVNHSELAFGDQRTPQYRRTQASASQPESAFDNEHTLHYQHTQMAVSQQLETDFDYQLTPHYQRTSSAAQASPTSIPMPLTSRVTTDDARAAEEAFRRGEIAMTRNQPEEAIHEFQTACDLNSGQPDYAAMLAWAKFCASDDKAALVLHTRVALERAMRKSKDPERTQFYLSRIDRVLGHDKAALLPARDGVKLGSTRANMPANSAALRTPAGRQLTAQLSTDNALRAGEAFKRGELAMKRDQPGEAILEFKTACDLNPNEVDYTGMLAWAKFCAAEDKAAIGAETRQVLERVVCKSNRPQRARFYLGRVERMLGRDKQALHHFREVLDVEPSHREAASELRAIEARLQAAGKAGIFGRKR